MMPRRPALDPAPAFRRHRKDEGARWLEGKARFIFPIIATGVVVFVASAAVTYVNIGPRADFVPRWLAAYSIGWPVAAVTGYIALASVRRVAARLVELIEDKRI